MQGRIGDCVLNSVNYAPDRADDLEDLLSSVLEDELDAPFIRSGRFLRAAAALVNRGKRLSLLISQLCAGADSTVFLPGRPIYILGSQYLFDQSWETLSPADAPRPWSIDQPVVRMVANATSYTPLNRRKDRLNVTVVSARANWSRDIPPRQITLQLKAMQRSGFNLGLGVVKPAYPNEIEASLPPLSELGNNSPGTHILHIDTHGLLLSYENFVRDYADLRARFEQESWGRCIPPYAGFKAFVLINGVDRSGRLAPMPVTGEEIAGLCRAAGIELVVLNACQAASGAAEGGIALDLIRSGVPDVIAFRHKVTAEGAEFFVPALYAALAQGLHVADACCRARAVLYEHRVRRRENDEFLFPDWSSVVHYASRPVEPHSPVFGIASELPPAPRGSLPEPLEWALLHIQDLIFKMRLSSVLPQGAEAATPRPIVLFGPIGAGAETLLIETADWLAATDLQVSGATVFDLGSGLNAALQAYFGEDTTGWSHDAIIQRVLAKWGPSQAFGFINFDLGTDNGAIGGTDRSRILALIAALPQRELVTLLHSSRDLNRDREKVALGMPFHAVPCGSVSTADVERWMSPIFSAAEDDMDAAVARLLCWMCASHIDLMQIVRSCGSPRERADMLSFLVTGARTEPGGDERFSDLRGQTLARWDSLPAGGDRDSLVIAIAALGSGIIARDLTQIGRPIGGAIVPSMPAITLQSAASLLNDLLNHSLADSPAAAQLPAYSVFRLSPLLRPLARRGLAPEMLEQLDDWTVAFAAEKIDFFSRERIERRDELQLAIFVEYAWSLFAIALWLAQTSTARAAVLAPAVRRAVQVGWWPAYFDITALFSESLSDDPAKRGGTEGAEADRQRDAVDALFGQAIDQQRNGNFARSKALLAEAIQRLGGNKTDLRFSDLHYQLGTVLIDLGDFDAAAEALSTAEQNAAQNFVAPGTLANVLYEQGVVAKNRGRWTAAEERFKSAVQKARALGSNELVSLCFQELAEWEIRLVPLAAGGGEFPAQIAQHREMHLREAESYLTAAQKAAANAEGPADQAAPVQLLHAKIDAARGRFSEARKSAENAETLFRETKDPREREARNFIRLLGYFGTG